MRRLLRPAGYATIALVSLVAFVAAGQLSADPLAWRDTGAWLERVDPVDALVEFARWVGIALAGYMLAVALVALAGELAGAVRLVRVERLLRRLVGSVAIPALRRRLLEVGAAASITASSLNAMPIGATLAAAPAAAQVADNPELPQSPVMLRGEYQGFGLPSRASTSTDTTASVRVVQPGDTLWGIITAQFGWCDDELLQRVLAVNLNIEDPHLILPGWRITLPASEASGRHRAGFVPRGEATWTAVTVQPGDTLWGIVERVYGYATADLVWAAVDANPDIDNPDLIYPGQVITVPPVPGHKLPSQEPRPEQPRTPRPEAQPHPRAKQPPHEQAEVPPPGTVPAPATTSTTTTTTTGPPTPSERRGVEIAAPAPQVDDAGDTPRPPVGQLVGWTGGAALAAALLGLGLYRRRHGPRGQRGHKLTRRAVELGVALHVTENLSTVERAANALRNIASRTHPRAGETTPMPRLLRLAGDEIELLWDAPNVDVLSPWATGDGGWTWRLDLKQGCNAPGTPHPCPCLVTVGQREGAEVLLNLEACGSLAVTGDRNRGESLLRSMTVELAASRFADSPTVLVVGDSTDLPGEPEHSRVVDVNEAVAWLRDRTESATSLLAHRRFTSLFALRARSRPNDAHEPVIVVVDAALGSADELSTLVGLSNGDLGAVVIVLGDHPGASCRVEVDGQRVRLEPLALELDGVGLEPTVSCLIDEIIPAPQLVLEDDEPTEQGAETSLADDVALAMTHDTGVDLAVDEEWDVELKVLGQVRAIGTKEPLSPIELHLAIYLAFHRYGENADTISTMIWPEGASPKTLTNTMGSLRRKLGSDPDGNLLFPLGREHQHTYSLSDRVITDWDRFRALVARAQQVPDKEATAVLDEALDLVDGPPFRAASGFSWASIGTNADIINGVTAAAERCVQLHLDAEDADAASRAGFKGLNITDSPDDARDLIKLVVEALCLAGNETGAAELRTQLVTDD
jgi:LysM repeat protein